MKTPSLPPFEDIVERHGPAVLRFCIAQVGVQRGEDCFQETMLAALRAYNEVRDARAVRSWLFAIAARKAIDLVRAQARAPQASEQIVSLAPAVEPAHPEPKLWQLVQQLPDKQRQAVTLRYVADLSHRKIAVAMQTTEAAARRNVFEGLSRLKVDLTSKPRRPSQ